jgi:hypothetical protein
MDFLAATVDAGGEVPNVGEEGGGLSLLLFFYLIGFSEAVNL